MNNMKKDFEFIDDIFIILARCIVITLCVMYAILCILMLFYPVVFAVQIGSFLGLFMYGLTAFLIAVGYFAIDFILESDLF